MLCEVSVLPDNRKLAVEQGTNLLACLRSAGLAPDAPCGGNGRCGKCTVTVNGQKMLACKTAVTEDMTVILPEKGGDVLQPHSRSVTLKKTHGYAIAIDLGTTTVAACLMDGAAGKVLSRQSITNPQQPYGADVISRIQRAVKGDLDGLQQVICQALDGLCRALCHTAGVDTGKVKTVCLVGNPAMQQLFLGIDPQNLARIPFAPALREPSVVQAGAYLPGFSESKLMIVPDIAGFVGADTVACLLASGMDEEEKITLLVDIGTNAELVLGNREKMVACSAAAGPALEGANIQFGMRAAPGAIDHARIEDGRIVCSVIGGGEAKGICGSGLVDAVACAVELGWINSRGKLQTADQQIRLCDGVVLTQADIRQVQLAKGAVAAAVELLAGQMQLQPEQIHRVYLAGAFGSYLNVESACRIGLLPEQLQDRVIPLGNSALSGAMQMACDEDLLMKTASLLGRIEAVELGSLPDFMHEFATHMGF